ncbi:MAG: TIGR02281 family clan AA aspartic protease [Magnetococcales bacterium]|nr:TIGR02281 family clan AA aspartic protease [Magnetococcales bacterium]
MIRFLLIFGAALGLAAMLHQQFLGSLSDSDSHNDVMGYAAISSFLLAWLLNSLKWRALPGFLKNIGLWLLVLFLLTAAYGWRHDLVEFQQRFFATVLPQRGFSQGSGSWSVYKSSDGHFHVEPRINGISIRMLVDTGASDIVLTRSDARRIGLSPDRLEYTIQYRTANGMTRAAPVMLDELRLGDFSLRRVPASVNAGDTDDSLLGMTFFKRLDAYEVKNDLLTLRWNQNNRR